MSARMQYPLSQRRHTNVAVVRYTRHGVRLEIACYKNKVMSYRAGTEKRLDEVLQVERVFTNVARGYVASEKDIAAVFGPDMSEQAALQHILLHGEVQVAQHERSAELEDIFKDVAMLIAQKCVHVHTQRPFPLPVIEQALRAMGAGVKLDQPVKKQALALMHQLIEAQVLPIRRANMRLRCNTTTPEALTLVERWCAEHGVEVLERCANAATPAQPPCNEQPVCEQRQDDTHTGHTAEQARTMEGDGKGDDDDGSSSSSSSSGDVPCPPHASRHAAIATMSLLVTAQPHLYRELDMFVKKCLPSGSTVHTVDTVVTDLGGNQHNNNHHSSSSVGAVDIATTTTTTSLPSVSSDSTRGDVVGSNRGSTRDRTVCRTVAIASMSPHSHPDAVPPGDKGASCKAGVQQRTTNKPKQRRAQQRGRYVSSSDADDVTGDVSVAANRKSSEMRADRTAASEDMTIAGIVGAVASATITSGSDANARDTRGHGSDMPVAPAIPRMSSVSSDDDDDDDDDRRRRQKKKKKSNTRKKATMAQTQQQQQASLPLPADTAAAATTLTQRADNSDDELEGNRRQRRSAKKKEEAAACTAASEYDEWDEAHMADDIDDADDDTGHDANHGEKDAGASHEAVRND